MDNDDDGGDDDVGKDDDCGDDDGRDDNGEDDDGEDDNDVGKDDNVDDVDQELQHKKSNEKSEFSSKNFYLRNLQLQPRSNDLPPSYLVLIHEFMKFNIFVHISGP